MKHKKLLSMTLAAVVLMGSLINLGPIQAAESTGLKTVTILHTNDTHGRGVEDQKKEELGYAKLKTFKSTLDNAILVDAGDTLHGTTFATISKGQSIVDLMNETGTDVFAPGNHDFNYGADRLVELAKAGKFQTLAANVMKGSKLLLGDNYVKEINGLKIGFFGLATPETKTKSNPLNTVGVDFLDYITVAKQQVQALKAKNVDAIVCVSHLGLDESSSQRSDLLAKNVEGINLIIDGHSHTKLDQGKLVGDTLIAQTGEHFHNVGKVTLTFKDNKLVDKNASLVPYSTLKTLTPDEKVLDLIKKVEESNKPILEKIVGRTDLDLVGEREKVRTGETNLGNLLTDAMLDVSGADVAITNGGGIRASIPTGDITMEQVITSFPFANYPVKINVTGETILKALEYGVDKAPEVVGKFPHVGGMTFKYDSKQAPGQRVFDVKVKGQALDLNKTYSLVTNDFMAVGGDGYEMFKGSKEVGAYPLLSEVLAKYIQKHSPIKAKVEGRVVEAAKEEKQAVSTGFTDIDKHWAKDKINYTVEKGLFAGTSKTTFDPNGKVTRAMFVTTLGRFEEKLAPLTGTDKNVFKDVQGDTWYTKYVNWAAANKVVSGFEDGTFKPDQEITRQEMASMISRYVFNLKKQPLVLLLPEDFKDDKEIGSWAREAIYNAVAGRLIFGTPEGNFLPKQGATRGELASILYNLSENFTWTKKDQEKPKDAKEKVEKQEDKKDADKKAA